MYSSISLTLSAVKLYVQAGIYNWMSFMLLLRVSCTTSSSSSNFSSVHSGLFKRSSRLCEVLPKPHSLILVNYLTYRGMERAFGSSLLLI